MMILELHRQGLSVSAIAARTGHDRKTVRKYIREAPAVPKYKPRTPPRACDRAVCGLSARAGQRLAQTER